jgi:peptidyl-tRNA hydrolase
VTEPSLPAIDHWRSHWRAAVWAERADRDDVEAWSLPLVVRAEKASPPDHQHAMYAAARSVVSLLASTGAEPEGPWYPAIQRWADGFIRKVVRRARGVRWPEVQDLAGVTVAVGTAEVRALLPHRVAAPPVAVSKLQVQGLDLEADPERALSVEPTDADGPVLTIAVAPGLEMTTGKACAQVGHAAQLGLLELDRDLVWAWASGGFPLRLVSDAGSWKRLGDRKVVAAVVRDAGYTEVAPGTVTCASTFDQLA